MLGEPIRHAPEEAPISEAQKDVARYLISRVDGSIRGRMFEGKGSDNHGRQITIKKDQGNPGSRVTGKSEIIYDPAQNFTSSELSFYVDENGSMGIRDVLDGESMNGPYDTNFRTAAPRISKVLDILFDEVVVPRRVAPFLLRPTN